MSLNNSYSLVDYNTHILAYEYDDCPIYLVKYVGNKCNSDYYNAAFIGKDDACTGKCYYCTNKTVDLVEGERDVFFEDPHYTDLHAETQGSDLVFVYYKGEPVTDIDAIEFKIPSHTNDDIIQLKKFIKKNKKTLNKMFDILSFKEIKDMLE